MPIHLGSMQTSLLRARPIYRRRFLQASAGSLLVVRGAAEAKEAPPVEEDLVYLANDTHIGEKHPADAPPPRHLRQLVGELVERERRPSCVLINGDLALKDGQAGDYRHFAQLIRPLESARIACHVTLGNHDHRETFYGVMRERRPERPPIKSRHISVVRTKHANFFLLDSLQRTMVTSGTIGRRQREWLARALDAFPKKPAIVVAHHNPRLGGDLRHFPGGLVDSEELWKTLAPRTWVKAYVHGHIHDRGYAEHQGIHILNTPATSYVADPTKSTTAWTTARLSTAGVELTTHTTDPSHPWSGQKKSLRWRAG